MKIIIAGVGEVGRHLAKVFAGENHHITLIDCQSDPLESSAENLDVRTLIGSAPRGDVLLEAGADRADLFVAATRTDEINLLAASVAKGLGSRQTIARVHHSAFHAGAGIDYARLLQIDQLVCPEYLTSLAITGVIRDPAVNAIEHFARGQILMERVEVSDQAEVSGQPLKSLALPAGFRIATVTSRGRTVVPNSETILCPGDQIALIGATEVLDKTLPRFRRGQLKPRRVVIMGGSPISVWLARALDQRVFRVRIYVQDRPRAEELAEKLPHATVLEADPTDPDIFAEENVADADTFVAALDEDEHNILAALQAKHLGVKRTVAVINRPTYHQLIEGLGIDRVFSPRIVAAREIQRLSQRQRVQTIARLDEQGTGVYEIRVGPKAKASGMTRVELPLPKGCLLVAIQRGDTVRVPGAGDRLAAGDTVVAIARDELKHDLTKLFA